MAPSTPPPLKSVLFAAFTITSTFCLVISPFRTRTLLDRKLSKDFDWSMTERSHFGIPLNNKPTFSQRGFVESPTHGLHRISGMDNRNPGQTSGDSKLAASRQDL